MVPHQTLQRRQAFQIAAAVSMGALSPIRATGAHPQAEPSKAGRGQSGKTYETENRFPRMMQNFLVPVVRQCHRRSVEAKKTLENRSQAEAYVAQVRAKVKKCFGPLPDRVPLNTRVTGTLQRDGYRIEKVLFDSRPNFPVTANFYVPDVTTGRVPGVVGTCGHTNDGKADPVYQSFAQGLARLGYACVIFDPIGQGERLQFPAEGGGSRIGIGVREHLHGGNQQFLINERFVTWSLWDAMRAVDFLLSRDEVDPNQIGVTGNSGGGTQTTWMCGMDRRLTMAAPSCFVTTLLRNAENELPVDTEQCPPRALELGLEHEDFLVAMAPKPIRILGKERDFFDIRGSEAAYQRLKRFYSLFDAEDDISLTIGPTEHGFTIENREFMYQWFNRATGKGSSGHEPELQIEKVEDLWCLPHGQVCVNTPDWKASRTISDFTREKALRLQESRKSLSGPNLISAVKSRLGMPDLEADPPHVRILRLMSNRGHVRKYPQPFYVETEPNAAAICYWLSDQRNFSRLPKAAPGRVASLYVSHRSSDEELRSQEWLRDMIAHDPEQPFLTCDVRGIGESLPNTCGGKSFDEPYGADYFYAIHGVMLGRPYLGQKTFDLLRVIQWLGSRGYDTLHLIGSGDGATIATFASLFAASVKQVTLHQPLPSYESIATETDYDLPLSMIIPDVLVDFDLPDCRRELKSKKLSILS